MVIYLAALEGRRATLSFPRHQILQHQKIGQSPGSLSHTGMSEVTLGRGLEASDIGNFKLG